EGRGAAGRAAIVCTTRVHCANARAADSGCVAGETHGTPGLFPSAASFACHHGRTVKPGEAFGMEQLKVIGAEDDALVLATESGDRYALPIDEVIRAEMRRARRER